MRASLLVLLLASFVPAISLAAAPVNGNPNAETRLLRFPTIHGKDVVFCYGGDLYTVSSGGGVARRLTSHEGYEMFPRFSPDGKHVAFTGQYDGNTEVYLMAAEGGVPKRHTVLGHPRPRRRVRPDGAQQHRHRLDPGREEHPLPVPNELVQRLHRPALQGPAARRTARATPAPYGGFCSYSPDGKKSWPTTASSASSAPGSATGAAWPTMCGSTIFPRRKRSMSPITPPRTSSPCGTATTSISSRIAEIYAKRG